MAVAWRDFILWAAGQPEMLRQFREATGRTLDDPSRQPIEAAIDDATGKADDDRRAFVEWVTRTHWGLEYAPEAYRQELPGGS